MGKHDSRNSMKMRRRKAQVAKKARAKRQAAAKGKAHEAVKKPKKAGPQSVKKPATA